MSDPGPLRPEVDDRPVRSFSLVWLFPLVAVAVTLGLLWRDYAGRGPVIEVAFATAAGLVAGETPLRYRSVEVGRVEDLSFTPDLSRVVARIRLDADIAPFVDEDAAFWVVRPEVTARGVTGLETVISGSYIEGTWNDVPGAARRVFEGLDEPPLTPSDTPGRRVTLRAADGGALAVGAPVFYRQVEVGRIESKRLTEDGEAVEFDLFVNAPHDRRLTRETRFWVVSGVDLSFGADGARFRIGSLAALLQGGVAFEDFSRGAAEPAPEGFAFDLFASPRDARTRALETDPGAQLLLDIFFGRSVRGLSVGAAVEYEGIRVGRVVEIAAEIDRETGRFSTRTRIAVAPSLLGLEIGDVAGAEAFMAAAVGQGLRAQLAQGNLLTGALIVRLVESPEEGPASLARREGGDAPIMPAIPSDLDELAGSVQGALRRIERLPIEALFDNAVALLDNVNRIVGSEAARAAPERALAALDAATALLSAPGLAEIPAETAALLAALNTLAAGPEMIAARDDLAATLASARAIAAALEASPLPADAAAAAAALRALLEDPALAALPASAAALLSDPGLRAAPGELSALLTSLRALVEDPALRAAPGEANAALASLRAILARLEAEDAAGDIAAAAAAARALLADPALARLPAESAAAAAALRARLEDPALAGLAASLAALLDDPGLRATPGALAAALASAQALLDDPALRTATEEAARTLAAARAVLERLAEEDAAGEVAAAAAAARALLEDPSLTRLAGESAAAAAALRAVLAAPGAEALPDAATAALSSTAAFLDRLREEDLAGTAAEALASLREATGAVARAAEGTPALVARLTQLSARADAILSAVDIGSELNYETVAAIREIRDAARAITDLATLVQRQPNALIMGK